MSRFLLLIPILALGGCGFPDAEAQGRPASFPESWFGKWTGEIHVLSYEGKSQRLPMQLTIGPKDDGKWQFAIQYGSQPTRNYELVAVKPSKGRYQTACEERGWIVVGSMNSKNGPWGPIQAAIDAVWTDTEARFKLSPDRRYASGFSGGSRVSFALSEMKAEHFAGVIGIGAGLSSGARGLPKKTLAVWIMCGETDFNLKELNQLSEKLKANGNPLVYRNFPGAHTMPPAKMMGEAVRWLDDQSASRQAEMLAGVTTEATEMLAAGEAAGAWVKLHLALEEFEGAGKAKTAAEKLMKTLARTPEAKIEVKALGRYEKAMAWVRKNQERMEKSTSAKAQGVKKLTEVVSKYPGTHAAKLAEQRLAELE